MNNMARPKSNFIPVSISFDREVLEALELRVLQSKTSKSTLVNDIIKKAVMSEYEFYRQKTKIAAAELHKLKTLMETAPDAPGGEK